MTSLVILQLLACGGDKGDSAAPVADPAVPWVAITAATAPDYLKSSCTIGVDLFEGSDQSAGHAEVVARGGQWAGVPVDVEVLSTALGTWSECLNNDRGTGEQQSGTFSAAPGDLFVFHYVGTSAAFMTLKQGEDHAGGLVHAQFTSDTTQGDVQALAEAWGASVAASSVYAGGFALSWLDDTNVVEVLSALSQDARYVQGAPGWAREPEGW
jgi:hypothetical protein